MKIEIVFKNNNDEVLLRGGSVTGDILRAEAELEQMCRVYNNMIENGEICDMCENTGTIELEIAKDDHVTKTCPHVEAERKMEDITV